MNEDLMKSWEGYEPAPIEYLHSRMHELFHEFRNGKTNGKDVLIDGIQFNKIIAKAKTDTYEKYKKLDLKRTIRKTEL